jgi:hypothetical protein
MAWASVNGAPLLPATQEHNARERLLPSSQGEKNGQGSKSQLAFAAVDVEIDG